MEKQTPSSRKEKMIKVIDDVNVEDADAFTYIANVVFTFIFREADKCVKEFKATLESCVDNSHDVKSCVKKTTALHHCMVANEDFFKRRCMVANEDFFKHYIHALGRRRRP
jgi:hypothetical protein